MEQLTDVGDVDQDLFEKRFMEYKEAPNSYYVVVIEDITKEKIIGTATVFIEKKVLHGIGKVFLMRRILLSL